MGTPWRQTISCFLLILSLNEVPIFCQNVVPYSLFPTQLDKELNTEFDVNHLSTLDVRHEALSEPKTCDSQLRLPEGLRLQQTLLQEIDFQGLMPPELLQAALLNPNLILPAPNLPPSPNDLILTPVPQTSPPVAPCLFPQYLLPPQIPPPSCPLPNLSSSTFGIVRPLVRKPQTKKASCNMPVDASVSLEGNTLVTTATISPSINTARSLITPQQHPDPLTSCNQTSQQPLVSPQATSVSTEVTTVSNTQCNNAGVLPYQQMFIDLPMNPQYTFLPPQTQLLNPSINCPQLLPQEPILDSINNMNFPSLLPKAQLLPNLQTLENNPNIKSKQCINSLKIVNTPYVFSSQAFLNRPEKSNCLMPPFQQSFVDPIILNAPAPLIEQQTVNSQVTKCQSCETRELLTDSIGTCKQSLQQQRFNAQVTPLCPSLLPQQSTNPLIPTLPTSSTLTSELPVLNSQIMSTDCSSFSFPQPVVNSLAIDKNLMVIPKQPLITPQVLEKCCNTLPQNSINPSSLNFLTLLPSEAQFISQKTVNSPTFLPQTLFENSCPTYQNLPIPQITGNLTTQLLPQLINMHASEAFPLLYQELFRSRPVAEKYPTVFSQQLGSTLATLEPNLLPQQSLVNPLAISRYISSPPLECNSLPINLTPSPTVSSIQPALNITPFETPINKVLTETVTSTEINQVPIIQQQKEETIVSLEENNGIKVNNLANLEPTTIQQSPAVDINRQLYNEVANMLLNDLSTQILSESNVQSNTIQPTFVPPETLPATTILLPMLSPNAVPPQTSTVPILPAVPPPPIIIIEESRSKSKSWLPILLLALLNNGNCF